MPGVVERITKLPAQPSGMRLAALSARAFQRPNLRQGAAGTVHFEPGGVAFFRSLAALGSTSKTGNLSR
jgi:hypothetical protein